MMLCCRLILIVLLFTASTSAHALDICPLYARVSGDIEQRIKSGVPFQLLSVAVSESQVALRKIVRVEYDLWDEIATIEVIDAHKERVPLKDTTTTICKAISFPESASNQKYSYKLFLNPGLNSRFKYLRTPTKSPGPRLIKVDWDRVLKEFEVEKVLLENDFTP